jgi:hypothetical protein
VAMSVAIYSVLPEAVVVLDVRGVHVLREREYVATLPGHRIIVLLEKNILGPPEQLVEHALSPGARLDVLANGVHQQVDRGPNHVIVTEAAAHLGELSHQLSLGLWTELVHRILGIMLLHAEPPRS